MGQTLNLNSKPHMGPWTPSLQLLKEQGVRLGSRDYIMSLQFKVRKP